tara:strand:+ start:1525 stop:1977 length:453 start_codon:yes stop_codon:yes gene_type:complete
MDIITSLLDRFKSPNKKDDDNISIETFGNNAILAICILMIEVSRSDDNYDDVEKEKILSILKSKYELDETQLEIIMKIANQKNEDMISLYEWTTIINNTYQYDERVKILKSLWEVAHADNVIDKYEDYTIRKIADLIYVKHSDFIKAKHK